MQSKLKNGKLVVTLVLFLFLCVAFAIGEGRMGNNGRKSTEEISVTPTPKEPELISNVWLIEASGQDMTVLMEGKEKQYELASVLAAPLKECIVDFVVTEGIVTGLTVQQDTIEGKVLRIGENFVELEGYGVLALEEDSRVYRMYDGVEEVTWQEVLVGYTTSAFVLADKKVCAALIQKPVEVTSIRVLIQASSYSGYYHRTLELGSESAFYISDGVGRTEWKNTGEQITLTPELVSEYGGRIYIGTEGDTGKIFLCNVKRAAGVPSYRGTLEVVQTDGGLLVVNELSLEEYLYGVLPSEMPENFGKEALKAQAVCARSYACNQLLANRYHMYGAHVDDSMNCQVYQNYGETAAAIEAVDATFGRVLSRNGECITAYYFSCSYGHTADSYDIWGDNAGTLFEGVVQAKEEKTGSLEKNTGFVEFLESDREWYDADSVWFRWNTVLGGELNERILLRLKERQQAVPEQILIKVSEHADEMRFEQGEVREFGTLKDIIIAERGSSGVITKLILVGSKATYLLLREYNIRYVLAPMNVVYLQDGSTSANMNLLPSGYFTIEKEENHFEVHGGGYGHGAGMSQYGARYLASVGKSYDEILLHYYRETELTYLYR